ncbi:hypothetical protein Ahy_B10g105367 [Arachis hypogaea]|uniref:Uncharacterized protein n=1 Tax=Arachis hypogaea TaxID=3818 RepID=A0A444X7U8_ARAHY|nr:hypothetical protein Ahy_B10g105367 [Arachis hypogaea]
MFSTHNVAGPLTVGQQSHLPYYPLVDTIKLVLRQSYHFKSLYRKVWTAKQKAVAQIYCDLDESYNKVPRLLEALQSCYLGTIVI